MSKEKKPLKIYEELEKIKAADLSESSQKMQNHFLGKSLKGYLAKIKAQGKVHSKVMGYSFLKRRDDIDPRHLNYELSQICEESKISIDCLKKVRPSLYESATNFLPVEDFNNNPNKAKNILLQPTNIANKKKFYTTKEESLLKMKEFQNNHKLRPEFLEALADFKNRHPAASKYHPNFEAIRKHTKETIIKDSKEGRSDYWLPHGISETGNTFLTGNENLDEVHIMPFGKYCNRDKNSYITMSSTMFSKFTKTKKSLKKTKKTSRSMSNFNKINSTLSFKLMLPREKERHYIIQQPYPNAFTYSPNYNYLFKTNYCSKSPELMEKQLKMKKEWTNYNPLSQYVVIPKANDIHINSEYFDYSCLNIK